jgi:hypothetical protein
MQSQTDPENVNAEIFKAGLSSGKEEYAREGESSVLQGRE